MLAIGGIGGLAIGLAGREICENLLNGFLLMTTVGFRARGVGGWDGCVCGWDLCVGRGRVHGMRVRESSPLTQPYTHRNSQMPFEVGEEVVFSPNGQVSGQSCFWFLGPSSPHVMHTHAPTLAPTHPSAPPPPPSTQTVEGIVLDVGWYRTTIRSFEREVYVIPNAVFSKNTLLNVTRKMRWVWWSVGFGWLGFWLSCLLCVCGGPSQVGRGAGYDPIRSNANSQPHDNFVTSRSDY